MPIFIPPTIKVKSRAKADTTCNSSLRFQTHRLAGLSRMCLYLLIRLPFSSSLESVSNYSPLVLVPRGSLFGFLSKIMKSLRWEMEVKQPYILAAIVTSFIVIVIIFLSSSSREEVSYQKILPQYLRMFINPACERWNSAQ